LFKNQQIKKSAKKQFMKKTLRFLLVAMVLTAGISVTQFITKSSTANAAPIGSYPDGTGGVWNDQVISYLTQFRYSGVLVVNIDMYGNRKCYSANHPGYFTTVYVSGGAIIGHGDFPDNN
jgi:hypothetical protein